MCVSHRVSRLLAPPGLWWVLALAGCAPAVAVPAKVDHPRIELVERGFAVVFAPAELPTYEALSASELAERLRTYVVSDLPNPPPMAGEVHVVGKSVCFYPRFGVEPGVRYRVVWQPIAAVGSASATKVVAEFAIARPPAPSAPTTAAIYPSANELPENQLRFYVYFSAPMSRGEAYRRIHLRDNQGEELEGAFLELAEELWDPEQRRFTLLCDPGRVKRGLKPREEMGAVLAAGKQYTLVVDREWRDAQGRPLRDELRKTFTVQPAIEKPIDAAAWRLTTPKPASRAPLIVQFPQPLDRALLERMLHVENAQREPLAGTVAIDQEERRWTFTPAHAWPAGDYQLAVDSALEDLAGNSIGRAFEADESQSAAAEPGKRVAIPFAVR